MLRIFLGERTGARSNGGRHDAEAQTWTEFLVDDGAGARPSRIRSARSTGAPVIEIGRGHGAITEILPDAAPPDCDRDRSRPAAELRFRFREQAQVEIVEARCCSDVDLGGAAAAGEKPPRWGNLPYYITSEILDAPGWPRGERGQLIRRRADAAARGLPTGLAAPRAFAPYGLLSATAQNEVPGIETLFTPAADGILGRSRRSSRPCCGWSSHRASTRSAWIRRVSTGFSGPCFAQKRKTLANNLPRSGLPGQMSCRRLAAGYPGAGAGGIHSAGTNGNAVPCAQCGWAR